MRAAGWIVPALAAGLLGAGGLAVQTATLVGLVTDEGGAPVSGAQIVVTHQLTGRRRGR